MRIIAGQAKGKRLSPLPRQEVRPTTNFAREALFNLLSPPIGQDFCDLYAGSGAVGMEALSRGARRAVFVEKNRTAAALIKKNATHCGFADKCEVLIESVGTAIAKMAGRGESFDVLFADPPYLASSLAETLRLLITGDLLKHDGVLIIQHAPFDSLPEPLLPCRFSLEDRRKYGNTIFSFFKINPREKEMSSL